MTSNVSHNDRDSYTNFDFNSEISRNEVSKAISYAKKGKSAGIDEIPTDVLKNEVAIDILHKLFSICFNTGIIPEDWSYSIITPIPKSSTGDA